MEYIPNKHAGGKSRFMGVPLNEAVMLSVGLVITIIAGGMLDSFGLGGRYLYLFGILLYLFCIVVLRIANRKNHPTFLFSFISFTFMQPRKIHVKQAKIKLKSRKEARA